MKINTVRPQILFILLIFEKKFEQAFGHVYMTKIGGFWCISKLDNKPKHGDVYGYQPGRRNLKMTVCRFLTPRRAPEPNTRADKIYLNIE